MSALGSSVINKSTKKFAPKRAPARRFQDENPIQTLATPPLEQSVEPQTIQKESVQPKTTLSSAASSSNSKRPPNLRTPSSTLYEQSSGNRSLPIPFPGQDPSLSLTPSRQKNSSRGKSLDPPRIDTNAGALIPPAGVTSSRTEPELGVIERVASDRPLQSPELEHIDAPPVKRRRVTSKRHQTETAPRHMLSADQNVVLPADDDSRDLTNDQDTSLTTQSAQTNNPRVPHNGGQKQDTRKAAKLTTQIAGNRSRKPRKVKGKIVQQPGSIDEQDQSDNIESVLQEAGQDLDRSGKTQPKRSGKGRGKKAIEDAAAAIVEYAIQGSSENTGKRGRRSKRISTPEEAQNVRINAGETKMADLCRDGGNGQKSSADKIIRENERAAALKKKQQEAQNIMATADDATTQALEVRESRLDRLDREWRQREEAMANVVPQQRIVNGEIVLDTTSLRIDRHAMAAVERDAEQMESVEEDEYTRKVNSSLGVKRDKSGGWNETLVDRFYDGLRMFGTDFGMISKLFPGKSRHAIKLKFCKEEKGDYPRIRATLLGEALPVELEEFQKMTGVEYDDPSVLERDIEEDKRKLEEEQEKEKEAIETARRERAEQAEAERLASQGQESSSKESQRRTKKKGERGRKGRKKGEKTQKSPARTKEKHSPLVESIGPLTDLENI